jgi:integrase
MPKMKLTGAAIAKLPAPDPSGKQVLYWDEDLTGFGLLASGKSAKKTFIVQRDLPGGRTRRVTIGPVNVVPLPEARRRAGEVLADLYKGVDPKARTKSSPTLKAVLAAYLEARKDLRPASRRNYQNYVERYLTPWADRPLREITPEMVVARHSSIQTEIGADGRRYDGETAANCAMRTLRLLWNWSADRDSSLGPSPTRLLKRAWFPAHQRTRYLTAEQLPAFHRAIMELPNPMHRDFLRLLLFAGLRLAESGALTWENVDLHERVLRVPAARTKAGRKLDLPMSDVVFDIFLERQRLGREKFVFPANTASRHLTHVHHPLQQIAIATGIKISAHDLRRTFITIAESTDISPVALKALVNHSLGSDVTSGYIQISMARLREAAQKVADRMKGLCEIEVPEGVERIPFTRKT